MKYSRELTLRPPRTGPVTDGFRWALSGTPLQLGNPRMGHVPQIARLGSGWVRGRSLLALHRFQEGLCPSSWAFCLDQMLGLFMISITIINNHVMCSEWILLGSASALECALNPL